MLYLSGKVKKLDLISVLLVASAFIFSLLFVRSYYEDRITHLRSESALYKDNLDRLKVKISMPRYPFATNYDRKDYHDYEFMRNEEMRDGPGELGRKYVAEDPEVKVRNENLYETFGFYCATSDRISVNRSLPDVRLESCKSKQYLKSLPKATIVIVYYNEYTSILKRALHSIYNRTPHDLLHEILLINDNSTIAELYDPLESYIRENFGNLVTVIHMESHIGLVKSRLIAARRAKGDVLVFLDAQVEVNVNWLPPLLEPIALSPKTVTTPIIDNFAYDTFEYRKTDDGGRGIFNWDLQYRRALRRPRDKIKLDDPISNPVMLGPAFAITRQFFWDLGSYDDGLVVYGGEQLEMSLKAHLCGSGMMEIPCSRIAHSFRSKNYYRRYGDDGEDYMIRNLKRIGETWLDEYKNVVFHRNSKFADTDPGDLLRAKTIRRGLHCKPFRFFLEFVAPEILERYPLESPGVFAQGTIQSKANPSLCLEVPKGQRLVQISECVNNFVEPPPKQFFSLKWHRNIQHSIFDFCISSSLKMVECHFKGGNQLWKYDLVTSQISQPRISGSVCLSFERDNNMLLVEPCNPDSLEQKWNWGEKNLTALQSWSTFGVEMTNLQLEP